uniref:Uncharacterized protein n=1 Tax=Sphaerodactylus townsendi TaxID=933632 RepID=A0ACB8FST0_9SAUR
MLRARGRAAGGRRSRRRAPGIRRRLPRGARALQLRQLEEPAARRSTAWRGGSALGGVSAAAPAARVVPADGWVLLPEAPAGPQVAALYVRENCHPAKASLLLWVAALRLPGAPRLPRPPRPRRHRPPQHGFLISREQLSVGGALWFTMDLTAPDHTLILPIMLGLLESADSGNFCLAKNQTVNVSRSTLPLSLLFGRGLSVLMVPVAYATVPSAACPCTGVHPSSFVGLSHKQPSAPALLLSGRLWPDTSDHV